MDKKLLLYLGAFIGIVIIVLGIIVLGSSNKDITGAAVGDSVKLTEKQRYAKFSAELTCDMVEGLEASENLEDAFEILEKTEELAIKYGFTTEEIVSLQTKYATDISIQQLTLNEMENFCPDFISQFEALQ